MEEPRYPLIFYESYSSDQIKAIAEILKEFEKIDIITNRKYEMLQISLYGIPPNIVIIDPIGDDWITNVYFYSEDEYTFSDCKSTKSGQFFIIETKGEPIFTLIIRNLY